MAAVPIIAGIASLAGTGLSIAGALSQGESNAASAEYNANRAAEQGEYSRWQEHRDLSGQAINAAKTLGSIRAAYGASGVSVDSGSAKDAATAAAITLREQTNDILSKGDYMAQQYGQERAAFLSGAIADRTGGQINAAGAGLSGVGKVIASTWKGGTPLYNAPAPTPEAMGSSGGNTYAF